MDNHAGNLIVVSTDRAAPVHPAAPARGENSAAFARGVTTTEERPDVNHPCENAAETTQQGCSCDCVHRHAPLPGKTKGKPKTKKRFAVEVGDPKDDLGNGLSALGP